LPTGALALLITFALRTEFFQPFLQHFQVPVKTLDYTPLQKLQTLLCSLAVGCTWTKDINHKLRPYPLAAQLLAMKRFPDQSSVNRFLHQLGSAQHQQLELISELLLQRFGLWQQQDRVDLDIDSSGLMVYGRTYEGSRKGYFPRQRGRHGYRVTIASTHAPAGSEILVSEGHLVWYVVFGSKLLHKGFDCYNHGREPQGRQNSIKDAETTRLRATIVKSL
jgi:hypothetical protein